MALYRRAARSTAATAAAIAAAFAAALAGGAISLWVAVVDHQSVPTTALNDVVVIAFAVVGAVVAAARPDNVIGWFMLAGGVAWSAGGALVDLAHHGIVSAPGSVPGAAALAVGGSGLRAVGWYLITLAVPIFFPDGRLAGPRWRWLPRALVVILVAAIVDPIFDAQADLTNLGAWHNSLAASGAAKVISAVAFLGHIPLSLVVTVAAIAQLVSRWRSGDELRRQQLTLFAAAVAVTILAVPLAFGFGAGDWAFGAAALPLPFTIGIAVLAQGLYDLRNAANRTLVWLTISAVVVGIYALAIVGVAGLVHVNRQTSWLPWVAAGVVAVTFAPLRDSLQRAVNRITYGRWDEPYDVLAALGKRLEGTADVHRLLADVVIELEGLGLRSITIRDQRGTVLAGGAVSGAVEVDHPKDGRGLETQLALAAYGEMVGSLRFVPPKAALRSRDRQLLDDLAGHLGGVLHALRLSSDVRMARERLVLAREEERRRLRRDLHDGLGPALAGHLLRLDLLAGRLRGDAAALADADKLRDDLRATIVEVRRVVEGLRPPALDELGLVGALQQVTGRMTAGSPVAVSVVERSLPPLPAAVEVAAFRIVSEAVTNVVKHAGATRCEIEVQAAEGRLCISVEDDGNGRGVESAPSRGNGMQTMAERAEELRGEIRVTPGRRGIGTRVTAELPLPWSPRAPRQHSAAEVTR